MNKDMITIMEHKIGETFEHGDVLLKVERSTDACEGCYFIDKRCLIDEDPEAAGFNEYCTPDHRCDYQSVIFVEQKRNTQ